MKNLLTTLCTIVMLFAAPSTRAGCYSPETYTEPYPNVAPLSDTSYPIGTRTVPGGGITITYGPSWYLAWDCDQVLGIPNAVYWNTCSPCTGRGFYQPHPYDSTAWHGFPQRLNPEQVPGNTLNTWTGDFANEPSAGSVAAIPRDKPTSGTNGRITFSQNVTAIDFWYSKSSLETAFPFYCASPVDPPDCDEVYNCSFGAYPGLENSRIYLFDAQGNGGQVTGGDIRADGTRDGTGCTGDPLGYFCHWTHFHIDITPSILPGGKARYMEFFLNRNLQSPFFIDNLTVCDSTGEGGGDGEPGEIRPAPQRLGAQKTTMFDVSGRRLQNAPLNGIFFEHVGEEIRRVIMRDGKRVSTTVLR